MKNILFVLFIISVSTSLFAQSGSNELNSIKLQYRTNFDTVPRTSDTISVPKGSALYFEIFVNGTDTLDGFLYKRYYGDESYRIDSFRTSSHVYDEPGGYYFRIEVRDTSGNFKRMVVPIQVALDPDWRESNTTADETPVCDGDSVIFTGVAKDKTWEYSPQLEVKEDERQLVDFGDYTYESDITLESFDPYRTLNQQDIDSLKSIEINLEHSDMQSVKVELICPDDSTVILKNYGGMADIGLGRYHPSDEAIPGICDTYTWSMDTTVAKLTMSEAIGKTMDFTSAENKTVTLYKLADTISYKPYENLDKLIGCTINGDWKIKVTDSSETSDNGYVQSWNLNLSEKHFFPDLWTYTNTYYDTSLVWEGDSISQTIMGKASGFPGEIGINNYTLSVRDNWGFMHDTIFDVEVTRPRIDMQDSLLVFSGNPDSTVKFTFTNTAKWAKISEWQIDDVLESIKDSVLEKEYSERSGYPRDTRTIEYSIFLTAQSIQGCIDTASAKFFIEAGEPKIRAANIFTPNNDNKNDIFTLGFENGNPYPFKRLQVKIFNRWGRVVKEWDSWSDYESNKYFIGSSSGGGIESGTKTFFGWDGKIKNSDRLAPPGIYYYWVLVYDLTGKMYKLGDDSSQKDEGTETNNNQGTNSTEKNDGPSGSTRNGKGKKGGYGGFFYLVR